MNQIKFKAQKRWRMTQLKTAVEFEFTIMDGTRHPAEVHPRADQYRALHAEGRHLGDFPKRRDAQRAIFEADLGGAK